jgi:hypothetical protein
MRPGDQQLESDARIMTHVTSFARTSTRAPLFTCRDARRANPLAVRHLLHRRSEAEHMPALVAAVAQDDLVLVVPALALLAHQRENVVGDLDRTLLAVLGRNGWAGLPLLRATVAPDMTACGSTPAPQQFLISA